MSVIDNQSVMIPKRCETIKSRKSLSNVAPVDGGLISIGSTSRIGGKAEVIIINFFDNNCNCI